MNKIIATRRGFVLQSVRRTHIPAPVDNSPIMRKVGHEHTVSASKVRKTCPK